MSEIKQTNRCPNCGQEIPGEETISARIATVLAYKGLTTTDLHEMVAKRLDISERALKSRLEVTSDYLWRVWEVLRIAEALNVSPHYLAFGTPDSETQETGDSTGG